MSMSNFIEENLDEILDDWDEVASKQRPAALGMSTEELRNMARGILQAVVAAMRTPQSEKERREKAKGEGHEAQLAEISDTARAHAADRLASGFTFVQLAAEYRALRASVVRRWRSELKELSESDFEDLIRFNEAIDSSLIESLCWYNLRLEDARDLLNGVLAHDLRSPLSAILNVVEVLLRSENLESRQMHSVVRARNSANRIRKMIDDLLDYTRTRLGTGLPISTENGDMGEIVSTVLEEQGTFHPELVFRYEHAGDLHGRWDRARIQQMLTNLVENAARHTRNGAPVSVNVDASNGGVSVSIHNEGSVIPENEQRVIFDPLRRAAVTEQKDRHRAGLGLGLYIARQIAEAHAGTIEVESSMEAGTKFTVVLPRDHPEGAATAGMT